MIFLGDDQATALILSMSKGNAGLLVRISPILMNGMNMKSVNGADTRFARTKSGMLNLVFRNMAVKKQSPALVPVRRRRCIRIYVRLEKGEFCH